MKARTAAATTVLRNTYFLLALTLIPTIIGAWAGMALGFANFATVHPIISVIGYLVLASVLIVAIHITKDSPVGIIFLMAFTGSMGVFLSTELTAVMHHTNGAKLIMLAAGGTALIFVAMAAIATVSTLNFSKMGPFLFIALIVLIIASVANSFLHLPAFMVIISLFAIILFSLYLIHDIDAIITGGEDNAIIATLKIYLDMINIFVNLLDLLEAFSDD